MTWWIISFVFHFKFSVNHIFTSDPEKTTKSKFGVNIQIALPRKWPTSTPRVDSLKEIQLNQSTSPESSNQSPWTQIFNRIRRLTSHWTHNNWQLGEMAFPHTRMVSTNRAPDAVVWIPGPVILRHSLHGASVHCCFWSDEYRPAPPYLCIQWKKAVWK